MDFEPIRKKIRAKVHHTRYSDRHPSIYSKELDPYIYLEWEYNDNTIYAKSEDFILISIIQDCIKVYLEETEEVK